jgi:Domain of unknown function (DUF4116)
MGFAQQLKKLSGQPMEEQNLLVKSYNDLKSYLSERKDKAMEEKILKHGIKAIENTAYAKDEKMVLYAIHNEKTFMGMLGVPTSKMSDAEKQEEKFIKESAHPSREHCQEVMKYVSPECSSYRDIALFTISTMSGENYNHLSDNLKNEKDVTLEAVRYAPCVYETLPNKFKDDIDVTFSAMKRKPEVLEFAPAEFKDHEQLLLQTIQPEHNDLTNTGIKFASDRLKNDKAFALEFLAKSGDSLPAFSDAIRADRECVMVAVKAFPLSFEDASKELRDDRGVALEAIKNCDPQDWYMKAVLSHASPVIQAMAGSSNEVANLTKGIATEKFSQSLEHKLAPKAEAPTRKMKI